MPQTQSGINYVVRNADGRTNRQEHYVDGAAQTTEILQCNWSDWSPFKDDLLGYGEWVGGNLFRSLPMRHPKYAWMVCTELQLLEVIGVPDSAGGIGDFSLAAADGTALAVSAATFKSVLYELAEDAAVGPGGRGELIRYVQRQSRYGLELLELPNVRFEFADIPTNDSRSIIDGKATRPYPNTPFVYTWLRVPSVLPFIDNARPDGFPAPLWANIVATVGKINSDTFDGFYPPGTLLCGAPEVEQRVGPTGRIEFAVRFNFTFHSPQDNQPPNLTDAWNVKYRVTNALGVTTPGMYPIDIRSSGGDLPFRYAEFAKLFQNS